MNDLERIGLFKEMPYVTIGTPYKSSLNLTKIKGKNFLVPGTKTVCANDDGYFNGFSRCFEGEELVTYVGLLRKWRRAGEELNKSKKSWVPSSGEKSRAGRGDPSGCFTENTPAFSVISATQPFVHEKKNFVTSPGKKGCGYGYKDVCINQYPEYIMGNLYSDFHSIYKKLDEFHEIKVAGRLKFKPPNGCGGYFTENPYIGGNTELKEGKPSIPIIKSFIPSSYPKKDGGMKAGTFTPFPTHMPNPYYDAPSNLIKDYINKDGKRVLPNHIFSTYFPTSSILDKNVKFRCNNTNIGKIDKVMTY